MSSEVDGAGFGRDREVRYVVWVVIEDKIGG
jgi:hypothetical protein